MGFFSDDEAKQYLGSFFEWQDGGHYNLSIGKRIEEVFGKDKPLVILEMRNLDTGETWEMKYQFALMRALHNLGDAYVGPETPLAVDCLKTGDREYNGKIYPEFSFSVSVATAEDAKATEAKPAVDPELGF